MKNHGFICFVLILLVFSVMSLVGEENVLSREVGSFGIVIHAGAGNMDKAEIPVELQAAIRSKLNEALATGYHILEKGGTSMEAVEATIRFMEDCPLFNAGKGAVYTASGTNELDAAIMDGKTLQAGAVAAVKFVKNPISLARRVMEKSPHVMLIGEGAEIFAMEQGLEIVPQSYFFSEPRWKRYLEIKQEELKKKLTPDQPQGKEKCGTVGAVALDCHGNLAAGTSTGGMTYKRFGRVGDSPIIGAGTYANNDTCAISATGHGEYFIRSVVAYDISALMEYKGLSLKEAAHLVIKEKLKKRGGDGGIIGIDRQGNVITIFNTTGMNRGFKKSDGTSGIGIFAEDQ